MQTFYSEYLYNTLTWDQVSDVVNCFVERTVTYTFEPWKTLWPEIAPLFYGEHGKEAQFFQEHMHLKLDEEHFERMDDLGYLDNLAVRDNGTLIGYCITGKYPNPHFVGVRTAYQLNYFIRQSYRGCGIGRTMFQIAEQHLKEQGIQCLSTGAKTSLPYAKVFKKLGWVEVETLFAKWIGE